MADKAHRLTDEKLEEMEKRLRPGWDEKTEKPKSKMDLEIFESKRSKAM